METDMTKGNPLPVILKFMIPLWIGNVFQQLYNMADTIIVGRFIGAGALAAVGSTGTVMFLVTGLSQGMSTGFTVLTSQKYGAGDKKGVRGSVANGIRLSFFVILVLTVLSLLSMKTLLHAMNTPDDIFEDAYSYICVICIGIFTTVFYNLFSSFLRAVGNSRTPLLFLVFSACLNVVLDLFFITVFHMGVAGAAWATDLSQGISAVLCVIYIRKKEAVLVPDKDDWAGNENFTRHQLAVGIPMSLQFGITASGTMIMQSAVNLFGSSAVAAVTAASKIQSVFTQGMVAMGQAMATYCGQNFGKREIGRIHGGVRAAVKVEVIYSLICSAIVVTALPLLLGIFFPEEGKAAALLPLARTYVNICAVFYIPLSMIFIFRNTMQGCGYGLLPMLGGAVEFFARLFVAILSMRAGNFFLACSCDPAAWLFAGLFTAFSYFCIIRKIEGKLRTVSVEKPDL